MSEFNTIGLFYGSSTCYTEMAGEKIRTALRNILGETCVDFFNIADTPIIQTQFYDYLIFGIPTWDYGELQEDWEEIWDEMDALDFSGKKIAIYGYVYDVKTGHLNPIERAMKIGTPQQ